MNSIITLDNVSKRYFKQSQKTLKELVHDLFIRKTKPGQFIWALKDINLHIRQGESLGIIGKNGSGKSTLLKIIAGVTQPTHGRILVSGKIAPLIELGAGFHPELTGRENIFLSSAILGMQRSEIESKFDDIVEFSELHDFINTPVKYYSSGMYLRLAFAVAVHVTADIILIDEILAVGDTAFQQKCLIRLQEFKHQGKTIIMVSHSLDQIQHYSDRVILLSQGRLLAEGKPRDIIAKYQQLYDK